MLGIIIVLYNSNILESKTYNCFKDKDIKILVIDNSTKENSNEKDCIGLDNVEYLSMHGNVGLSVAYNLGIQHFKKMDIKYVVISDDDSMFEDNFIEEFNKIKGLYDIYVPIVKSSHNNVIYSPIEASNPLVNITKRMLKIQVDVFKIKKITAINSGTVIDMKIFDNYKYDEKIFLYFVDVKFFHDMHKLNKKIGVINSELIQEFSEFVPEYNKSSEISLQLRLNDAKIYFNPVIYLIFKTILVFTKVLYFKSFKPFNLLFYKANGSR